jgi:TetR/AcrR family transcriptional repressor of nem operon
MDPVVTDSRTRLLQAALHLLRSKGYTATTVDDICAGAGLTKGSFFHHFKGKEELAVAAAGHWNQVTGRLFATAAYQAVPDPRERLLAYIDFRAALLQGDLPDFTCLLGTLVQETYRTHPRIREACAHGIRLHAATLEPLAAAAKARYAPQADWTPASLAFYTQAVIQGAFILAKAEGGAPAAAQCIAHLKRYVAALLPVPEVTRPTPAGARSPPERRPRPSKR